MAANVTLLIVDDEALILLPLKEALIDAGYAVVTATNSQEAIAELDSGAGKLAGLITDIRMPGGTTGWGVARHARELEPNFPVLYMTGDSAHDWASHGVPNSAIVSKPFAMAQIITAISNLLNDAATNPLA